MNTNRRRGRWVGAVLLAGMLSIHVAPASAQLGVSIPPGTQLYAIPLSVDVQGNTCTVSFPDGAQSDIGISDFSLGKTVRWTLPFRNPDQSQNRFGNPGSGEPAGIDIHQDAMNPDFVLGHPLPNRPYWYDWTIAKWPVAPGTPDKYNIHAYRSTDGGTTWYPCVVNDPTIANDNGAELTKPRKHQFPHRPDNKKPGSGPY